MEGLPSDNRFASRLDPSNHYLGFINDTVMSLSASSSSSLEQVPEAACTSCTELSQIERFAPEIKFLIIGNLPEGDFQSIVNLAFTSRHFHTLIVENEPKLARETILRVIGEQLMPIATALNELKELPQAVLNRKYPRSDGMPSDAVINILNQYIGRENRYNWHKKIDKLSVAHKYLPFNSIVHEWEKVLSQNALQNALKEEAERRESKILVKREPSGTEIARFRKALYLFELVSTAFPWDNVDRNVDQNDLDEHHRAWQRLCDELAP
ncbi:hypothetical protein GGR58DRAFT_524918 [Xylaria digitata]|nr:hypothetical protein GGR58DRAFT_524918 [Xylaria digitata]